MSDIQNNLFTNLQGNQANLNLMATSSNPLFNDSATNKGFFWTIKIGLMVINAFTAMICIFIVLFGFAYPEEKFPGDLRGKNCALLSIVYIVWSSIGYCGAHHQKFGFLLVYSGLVVLYVFINIIVFGLLAPRYQWLDQNLFWIMCSYFTLLMAIGLLHAYQIRLKEDSRMDDQSMNYGLNYGTYVGQMPTAYPSQQLTNQMPLYANPPNSNLIDNTQLYMPNNYTNYNNYNNLNSYQSPIATAAQQQQQYLQQQATNLKPTTSGTGNYFQKSWQRMSSKMRSGYRPNHMNGNPITELKPMPSFNMTMPQQPY